MLNLEHREVAAPVVRLQCDGVGLDAEGGEHVVNYGTGTGFTARLDEHSPVRSPVHVWLTLSIGGGAKRRKALPLVRRRMLSFVAHQSVVQRRRSTAPLCLSSIARAALFTSKESEKSRLAPRTPFDPRVLSRSSASLSVCSCACLASS